MSDTELKDEALALLARESQATLSTLSSKRRGYPYASLVQYALTEDGVVVLFLSGMAEHSRNLQQDMRVSLLVTDSQATGDPLSIPRLSIMGHGVRWPENELEAAKATYFGRHDHARAWSGFGDFVFWRVEVLDSYYIAGFGKMGWI